jgi:hypothetical protein
VIAETLAALHGSGLAQFARGSSWFYPACTSLHVLGAATLFGSIALLDLRMMGAARGLALDALEPLAVRMALAGGALCLTTGMPMFVAGAVALSKNPVFLLKLVCLVAAAVNAFWHHAHRRVPARHGAVSLACWIVVLIAGSLSAYV